MLKEFKPLLNKSSDENPQYKKMLDLYKPILQGVPNGFASMLTIRTAVSVLSYEEYPDPYAVLKFAGYGAVGILLNSILNVLPESWKNVGLEPKQYFALFKGFFVYMIMTAYHFGIVRDVFALFSQIGKPNCSFVEFSDVSFAVMLGIAIVLALPHMILSYKKYLAEYPKKDQPESVIMLGFIEKYLGKFWETAPTYYGFVGCLQFLFSLSTSICAESRVFRLASGVMAGILAVIAERFAPDSVKSTFNWGTAACFNITNFINGIIFPAKATGEVVRATVWGVIPNFALNFFATYIPQRHLQNKVENEKDKDKEIELVPQFSSMNN